MELTSENVTMVFEDCLFKEGEDTSEAVKVEGLRFKGGLHPGRLEENTIGLESMLDQLPDNFKRNKGGGWSFLNMCNDKNDKQWTGMHNVMEQLVVLGIAIGKVKYTMPRSMWAVMPGGMPYIVIEEEKRINDKRI